MQGQTQWVSWVLIYAALFAMLYFVFIRPQRQQQRKRAEMLQKVKKGDRVVTVGGLHATVVEAGDDTLSLELAANVRVKADRAAIARVRGRREAE